MYLAKGAKKFYQIFNDLFIFWFSYLRTKVQLWINRRYIEESHAKAYTIKKNTKISRSCMQKHVQNVAKVKKSLNIHEKIEKSVSYNSVLVLCG